MYTCHYIQRRKSCSSYRQFFCSKVHKVSRSFVQAVVSKLQEKSPLTYIISRKLSCLNPKTVATESCEQNVAAFRVFVRLLYETNRVDERDADAVISQYKKFLDDVVATHKSLLLDSSNRADTLYHDLLSGNEDYAQLRLVVKVVLLLSHGQATVERGFSVNKQVDNDNVRKDIRRIICDSVAACGGIHAVDTISSSRYRAQRDCGSFH